MGNRKSARRPARAGVVSTPSPREGLLSGCPAVPGALRLCVCKVWLECVRRRPLRVASLKVKGARGGRRAAEQGGPGAGSPRRQVGEGGVQEPRSALLGGARLSLAAVPAAGEPLGELGYAAPALFAPVGRTVGPPQPWVSVQAGSGRPGLASEGSYCRKVHGCGSQSACLPPASPFCVRTGPGSQAVALGGEGRAGCVPALRAAREGQRKRF